MKRIIDKPKGKKGGIEVVITQATISAVMAELGSRTSKKKAASSAANGKKGGRPKDSTRKTASPKSFNVR